MLVLQDISSSSRLYCGRSVPHWVRRSLGYVYFVLPEDGPVWPKHEAHNPRMYIYFNEILNILTNILVN
jgi:hypothetical protein